MDTYFGGYICILFTKLKRSADLDNDARINIIIVEHDETTICPSKKQKLELIASPDLSLLETAFLCKPNGELDQASSQKAMQTRTFQR